MSQPAAPPVLTVRYEGSERTFAAGHDVVVGRDLRADVRVAHPPGSPGHTCCCDSTRVAGSPLTMAASMGSTSITVGCQSWTSTMPSESISETPTVRRWTSKWAATGVRPGDHPRRRRYACPTCPRERGPPTARRRPARSAPASYNSFHRPPPGYPPLRHRDHSRDTPPVGNSCGHPADRNGRRRFTGHPRPHRRRRVPAAELRRETSRHR